MSTKTIDHWIGGKSTAGSSERLAPVFDPATGRTQTHVRLASASDVDTAVRTAAAAFEDWRHQSLSKRSRIMFKLRDLVECHELDLARIIAAEHGKVVDDARGEIVRGREVIEFACGITSALKGGMSTDVSGGVDSYDFREPLGVCAGITPFNFPVMVPMWMHPVAIAAGNTFVLKPSERDPSASLLIAELYAEAGLPEGVFNVVNGDKEAVDALLTHPEVAAVSFVGSTPIAEYIHRTATANRKRVQALGGAKNHAVIMPDANLDWAADQLTAAAFGSAGQRCMAVSVAVAVGDAADELVDLLKSKAEAVKVGPGDDPTAEMGPVVTEAACSRITDYIDSGIEQGATPVIDGRGLKVEGHEGGFFVGPTVLDHVTPEMDVYRDEVFGPVLSVVRADTLEAAIDLINASPYGNGTAVFTFDGGAVRTFERAVNVGMIGVNVPIPVPTAHYSFGGWKDSLFGSSHIHGHEGVRFYTRAKVVTKRWPRHTEAQAAQLNFPTSS